MGHSAGSHLAAGVLLCWLCVRRRAEHKRHAALGGKLPAALPDPEQPQPEGPQSKRHQPRRAQLKPADSKPAEAAQAGLSNAQQPAAKQAPATQPAGKQLPAKQQSAAFQQAAVTQNGAQQQSLERKRRWLGGRPAKPAAVEQAGSRQPAEDEEDEGPTSPLHTGYSHSHLGDDEPQVPGEHAACQQLLKLPCAMRGA